MRKNKWHGTKKELKEIKLIIDDRNKKVNQLVEICKSRGLIDNANYLIEWHKNKNAKLWLDTHSIFNGSIENFEHANIGACLEIIKQLRSIK